MKLICNLSMLGPQPTGLGTYSENCVTGLAERFDLDFVAGNGRLPRGNVLTKAPESVAIDKGRFVGMRRYLWARSLRFDPDRLVYSPTHHGLPNQPGQIITVHDLIHLHFPSQHPQVYIYFRFLLPRLMKKCRAVFTVSETTRQDIFRSYGYPLEQIFVIPNGVDTGAFSPNPSLRANGDPYLLIVGGRHPHKNVAEVLDMSQHWKKNYRLIIASCNQGAYRRLLERKVHDFGLSDQVEFKDYLTHDELLRLYQGAAALLFPSLIEGFGIPPLEALACRTPVIASDISVLREVLGNAAQFVGLGSHQSWAEAIDSITSPSIVENHLIEGQKLLSKFTWKNAVNALERALLSIEPRLENTRRNPETY
ncbi:MAG: glycosyltransferase family 4 protein [Betaproteobacteria bacterium]|nr:glycosyltransferase family 4 protein [Betaproteobacteria bacterium]